MSQLLGMSPGTLLIYGLIVLGILYLVRRFVGENKGKVFLGLLGIVALVIFFRTPLQEAGWFPTELKGPFARAETSLPMVVPGEVIPGQSAPNLPNPAPNPKEEQQLPIPQLNGDFKIASSQSGCEVPSVWQRDSYYSASFQRAGCGPASVAMLLISQGFLDATKEAVKQLALDSYGDVWDNSGSNGVGALARLLNNQSESKLNAKGRTDVPWNEVLKLVQRAPTIVGIYSTEYPYYYPYGHYLVVLKIESDYVLANDPYAPAGEDFERQFPLEKFKSYYEAAGSKLVEIDPVACGAQVDSDHSDKTNGFDPYSSAKPDCKSRVQQVLFQTQGQNSGFVLKALNQNEFDYCSIRALLAGDLDEVLPDYGEEAIPQGKPALGVLGIYPFAKKLSGWLHFGRDVLPGKKEDGSENKRIFDTHKALVVAKVYIPSSRTDQRIPADQVTEEQRLLGVLLADTGYVLVAAARNENDVYMTIYGHLESIELVPYTGEELLRGFPIGEMGMTGNTLGLHVHYGIAKNPRWQGSTEEDSNGNPVKKLDGWYDPFPGE